MICLKTLIPPPSRGWRRTFQLPYQQPHINPKQRNNNQPQRKFNKHISTSHLPRLLIHHPCILFYLLIELNVIVDNFTLLSQLLNYLVGGGVGLLGHSGDVLYSLVVVVDVRVDLDKLTVSRVASVAEIVLHSYRLFYFDGLSIIYIKRQIVFI